MVYQGKDSEEGSVGESCGTYSWLCNTWEEKSLTGTGLPTGGKRQNVRSTTHQWRRAEGSPHVTEQLTVSADHHHSRTGHGKQGNRSEPQPSTNFYNPVYKKGTEKLWSELFSHAQKGCGAFAAADKLNMTHWSPLSAEEDWVGARVRRMGNKLSPSDRETKKYDVLWPCWTSKKKDSVLNSCFILIHRYGQRGSVECIFVFSIL